MLYPPKLQMGDLVRVIAPSKSLGIISSEVRAIACARLEKLGLRVSFSDHCEEMNAFQSTSVAKRVEDLHTAFRDKEVKLIFTAIGGYNSIQLLKYLDYELIRNNPKILCGYSDITALQNAILAKTGLVSYSGPHFSSFGCMKGIEFMIDSFTKCCFFSEVVEVQPCSFWSDDAWYLEQENRNFIPNEGFWDIHPGEMEGRILGGNLSTFVLLKGTDYMPKWKEAVLFLEEDGLASADIFDQHLQSLLLLSEFPCVQGIVIGRFERKSNISRETLLSIIASKAELQNVPIVANVDFGHTMPLFTFPIGGKARIKVEKDQTQLLIWSVMR